MPTARDALIALAVAILSLGLIAYLGYLGGFIATLLIIAAIAVFVGKDERAVQGARQGHPLVGAVALMLIAYLITYVLLRNNALAIILSVVLVLLIALARARAGRKTQVVYA